MTLWLHFVDKSKSNFVSPLFLPPQVFRGRTPYHVSIPEDFAVGFVVFNVSATDEDASDSPNSRVAYSLADNEAFQINPSNGDVIYISLFATEADSKQNNTSKETNVNSNNNIKMQMHQ